MPVENFPRVEEYMASNGVENRRGIFSPQPIREVGVRDRVPAKKIGCIFTLTKHFQSSSGRTMTALPPEVLKVAPLEKSNTL